MPKMEKVSDPKKYLEDAMISTGLDLPSFAQALGGYSPRTIRRMMAGEVKLSKFAIGQVEKLVAGGVHPLSKIGSASAQALQDEIAEYRTARLGSGIPNGPPAEGRAMRVRRVPVIGWAKAGEAMDFEDIVDWESVVEVPVNDAKAFGIRVKGDSMSPRICEGDIVVVSPSEAPRNEKPVVVRLRVQGVLCKQFHRTCADSFELRSLNPFYSPIVAAMADVVWIYPVIAIINYP